MLHTKGPPQLAIGGTNQQDFQQIQLIAGTYPYQIGLQKRVPGKKVDRVLSGPIGSIYVFYMAYGRTYTLTDFGSLQIDPIDNPNNDFPGLPPTTTSWFDNFADYEDDLIAKYWGAGAWETGIGVCESLLLGFMDAYRVADTVTPIPNEFVPRPGPSDIEVPNTTPTNFPIDSAYTGSTTAVGSPDIATDAHVVTGFFPPFLPSYSAYMDATARIQIPHPYTLLDPAMKRFKSIEQRFSSVAWTGEGGAMNDYQESYGYYTDNRIIPGEFVANVGDVIVIKGTYTYQTGGTYASPVYTSDPIIFILGVYPDIPEYLNVAAPLASIVRWSGTTEDGSAIAILEYTSYDVYPPE